MRINKYKLSLTIANNGTTVASGALPINGVLKGIVVVAPALSGSNTLTVTVKDSDGYTTYSKASLAESTTSTIFTDANNEYLSHPLYDNGTVTLTSSGTESPAVVIPVTIYYET